MRKEQPEVPSRIAGSKMVFAPDHFAQIPRYVGDIVDGIRQHSVVVDRRERIGDGIHAKARKPISDLPIERCSVNRRWMAIIIGTVGRRNFMRLSEQAIKRLAKRSIIGSFTVPDHGEEGTGGVGGGRLHDAWLAFGLASRKASRFRRLRRIA